MFGYFFRIGKKFKERPEPISQILFIEPLSISDSNFSKKTVLKLTITIFKHKTPRSGVL
jgi:hypothetical protein